MLMNSSEYINILNNIKQGITQTRLQAVFQLNKNLLLLYHDIGSIIAKHKSWGSRFVENLARDIRTEFPESRGFSERNLAYMAMFAREYPSRDFIENVASRIPWSHNINILQKVKNHEEREWYICMTAENNWSLNVLVHQIESNLYARQVLAEKVANFERRLPAPQGELAVEAMKDPYVFDFIQMNQDTKERDIEKALTENITRLLLELGSGFAFLGNQYHLNVGGQDYFIDLLFYNLKLNCFVVVELKAGDFKPEYAGKLNFYLSAVDDILKRNTDNPSIGLLLCKSKNNLVVEYSLRDVSKPIGVSEYRITSILPSEIEDQLPSVEDILNRIDGTEPSPALLPADASGD